MVFPEFDEDRVYISDIKKVLNWYNILQKEGLLEQEPELTEEEKLKPKAPIDAASALKPKKKDTGSKPLKTAGSKVATQGVRKTGVA